MGIPGENAGACISVLQGSCMLTPSTGKGAVWKFTDLALAKGSFQDGSLNYSPLCLYLSRDLDAAL